MALWRSPSKRMVGEQTDFMREITLRNERHTRELVAAMRAVQEESRAMQAEIGDQRKQIQAETQAILSVLDRLN